MDMSNPLTVVGIVLTAFIVLMVLSVVLEFLSHPIRFMVGCALVGALCEWLIVRPSMLERRAMEREAIERRQNAEHEKWKRYQDERHDWEWERDRTIWKDGNEE